MSKYYPVVSRTMQVTAVIYEVVTGVIEQKVVSGEIERQEERESRTIYFDDVLFTTEEIIEKLKNCIPNAEYKTHTYCKVSAKMRTDDFLRYADIKILNKGE